VNERILDPDVGGARRAHPEHRDLGDRGALSVRGRLAAQHRLHQDVAALVDPDPSKPAAVNLVEQLERPGGLVLLQLARPLPLTLVLDPAAGLLLEQLRLVARSKSI